MATTGPRAIQRYGGAERKLNDPVKAATKINYGALVVIDTGGAAGYLAPGRTATGLTAAGVSVQTVDNTGGAAGALRCEYRSGVFKFKNSAAGDLIAQTEKDKIVYIVDDETVAKTDGTGTRSAAGKCMGVDTDGVWVHVAGEN